MTVDGDVVRVHTNPKDRYPDVLAAHDLDAAAEAGLQARREEHQRDVPGERFVARELGHGRYSRACRSSWNGRW
jgi:hypothetical protein